MAIFTTNYGSVTTNTPFLELSQTWNNVSTSFEGAVINILGTAGTNFATSSRVFELQNNGITRAAILYDSATGVELGLYNDTYPYNSNPFAPAVRLFAGTGGFGGIELSGNNIQLISDPASNLTIGAGVIKISQNADVAIFRDTTGILGIQNTTIANPAGLHIYNTDDNLGSPTTNFERASLDWSTTSNVFTISTQNGGSGVARNIAFNAASGLTIVTGPATGVNFSLQNNNSAGSQLQVSGFAGGSVVLSYGTIFAGVNNNTTILNLNNGATPLFIAAGSNIFLGLDPTNTQYLFGPGNTFTSPDTALRRTAAGVLEINTTVPGTLTGTYIHWGGQARVTSDVVISSTTTLANVSGLSVNVAAGRTYSFDVEVSWTDVAAAGIQLSIGGSATVTNLIFDGWVYDSNTIKGQFQGTSLGATAINLATTTATSGHATIQGTITVNAAGTLTVMAANGTSTASGTTIKRGSRMIVHDMP